MININIENSLKSETKDSVIFVVRFTFDKAVPVLDFVKKARTILYDEIGSQGHFRVAPKSKCDMTKEYILGYGDHEDVTGDYPSKDNEHAIAFYVSQDSIPLTDELAVISKEISEFCNSVNAKAEQINIHQLS